MSVDSTLSTSNDVRTSLHDLESEHGIAISPIGRLLLATDGTVTHALEVLTRSSVTVTILDRSVDGGTLHRDVVLVSDVDGSELVWAHSEVNLYALDDELVDPLVYGSIGIGDLFREQFRETARELITFEFFEPGDDDYPGFVDATDERLFVRTYRIFSGGRSVMTITEYFPESSLFRDFC